MSIAHVTRRSALVGGTGLGALALLARAGPAAAAAGPALQLGPARSFSFAALVAEAERRAGTPYMAPVSSASQMLERIDYDVHRAIAFDPERTIWAGRPDTYPVQLFHLARFFQQPVEIHLVQGGTAREIVYEPSLFRFGAQAQFAQDLPEDLGFAGFRLEKRDEPGNWLAFLGASYFRSSGELEQYGLSARGLAIDTGMPQPEEFPIFTGFWLEPGADGEAGTTIHAFLDSPSIAGAYRMTTTGPGLVVIEVEARLFARADIARLGVAPLTSMYWFSETNRHVATDWRPEIHDSDGLAIWTGTGERLWRPLNNPRTVMTNSFLDRAPRGFGLMQRDRDFTRYEDTGAFYDRRPSAWVEPLDDWGAGAVQLVEIPTGDEIHDNIVAYWVPEAPARAGAAWTFRYRLFWAADHPYPGALARVVATRLSQGGIPGQPRPPGVRKIVVDFSGPALVGLGWDDGVEPVVWASRGEVSGVIAAPVQGTGRWRAMFDLASEGEAPIDLRLFLRNAGGTLSETWLWQYHPFEFPGASGA